MLQWVIVTALKMLTSTAASIQSTRALHWLLIGQERWESLHKVTLWDIAVHGMTLYFAVCVFLRFTMMEHNALISALFEVFAVGHGIALVLSMGQILTSSKRPWPFFALNMMLNLRCYVLSGHLVLPRMFAFLGTLVSFSLLNPKGMVDMHLGEEMDCNVMVLSATALYAAFGIGYDSTLLIVTAVGLLCAFTCFRVWRKTNSKRAAVAVLSVLAVLLIRIGFRFESGFINGLFGYDIGGTTGGGEPFEMYIIDKYLRNPFTLI